MLFSSFEFIFAFLPIVLVLYFWIQNHSARIGMILVASYVFYGFWNPKFVLLLLFSTSVDYWLGIRIAETIDPKKRKWLLKSSILVNLGVLGFFKYFNFFIDTIQSGTRWFAPNATIPIGLDVVLPIGISFYTFISLSYTIDVYYNRCRPHRNFLAYAGFVTYFPHLVAGPLIRHNELVNQLEDPSRGRFRADNFSIGICLFVIGLAKKILIADRIADAINPVLLWIDPISTGEAWLCAIGYSFQLYFDFSGYSDMAIGLARMMNIQFPQNFRSPYQATSITEFWQRWHITLSQWLRDYLYIPLGGNRHGGLLTYRNLILTMLLGGLWHGANWVFIFWGAFHGLCLALERASQRFFSAFPLQLPKSLKILTTFLIVTLGWVFFRSPDFGFAIKWFEKLFSLSPTFTLYHFEPKFRDRFFVALALGAIIAFFAKNTGQLDFSKPMTPMLNRALPWVMALLFVGSLAFFSKNSPFLYFQF